MLCLSRKSLDKLFTFSVSSSNCQHIQGVITALYMQPSFDSCHLSIQGCKDQDLRKALHKTGNTLKDYLTKKQSCAQIHQGHILSHRVASKVLREELNVHEHLCSKHTYSRELPCIEKRKNPIVL